MNHDFGPPQLDLTRVIFPMDGVTLGAMRKADSGEWSHGRLSEMGATDFGAIATHYWEQRLALKSFARTLRAPDPVPGWDRSTIVGLLHDAYMRYGLSSGPKQSVELVRRIEAQAVAQAKAHDGQSR